MSLKTCRGPCALDLSPDAFAKDANKPGGRRYTCRVCDADRRQAARGRPRAQTDVPARAPANRWPNLAAFEDEIDDAEIAPWDVPGHLCSPLGGDGPPCDACKRYSRSTNAIPLMITHDMRTRLSAHGFTDDAIAEMTPDKAHKVLQGCDRQAEKVARENDKQERENDSDARLVSAVTAGGASLMAFGLPIERASVEALLRAGSVAAAAAELQLTPRQLRAHLSELQRRAATRGYSPTNDMTKSTPEGFSVKGTSTYYKVDPDTGESRPIGQWVKTKRDEDGRFAAMLDALAAVAEPLRGLAEPIASLSAHDDDLLCVYPMGDPHLGMLAWPAETGNAFDLRIAEDTLFAAVDRLVGLAPRAGQAIVMNLGDFFHSDNKKNETTRGTPVDVDGRWAKVLAAGIRVMRRLIDRALEKHAHVTVINEIGNHDDNTSIMLSIALAQFYEREPRVTIDTSPEPFHWYRFGKVLIGVHHGDKTKPANLLGVMACDRAKDWGETLHRYWYIGHVHHDTLKELPGVTVESFRTLAGRDAWHHGQGYRSGRDMKLDVIHRVHGKINRHIVGIDQLLADHDAA